MPATGSDRTLHDEALLKHRRARYRIDLKQQMACCEANYARLGKLTPSLDECDQWRYLVEMAGSGSQELVIDVQERARYTTMLKVSQQQGLQGWAGPLQLQVRLYHDARMAEVVAWREHRRVQPRYEYPNDKMYQRDEKLQLNLFLADWLSHCLSHGHMAEPLQL